MSIKYIDYLKPSKATGLVAEVYKQVRRDFGQVVEPVALHSIIPELLHSNGVELKNGKG